jgi:hypothetical protein
MLCSTAKTAKSSVRNVKTVYCRSYFTTDGRSVGRSVSQYVLVSSTLVGLAIRYYFLSEGCCLQVAVLFLWNALSDESTGLQLAVQSINGPRRAEPVTIL